MKRFAFLSSMFAWPLSAFQTKLNTKSLDSRDITSAAQAQSVTLYARAGATYFAEVRVGTGLSVDVSQIGSKNVLTLNALPQTATFPLQSTQRATGTSPTQWGIVSPVDMSNRNLQVYLNGLFQTPGFDYTRTTDKGVTFNFDQTPDSTVTFTFSGV